MKILSIEGDMVMRKLLRVGRGGSSSNGFYLLLGSSDVISKPKQKKTLNYEHTSASSSIDWVFACVLLAVYFLILFFLSRQTVFLGVIKVLGYFLAFISAVFMPSLIYMAKNKDEREWHACEHKTANLLGRKLDVSMNNLKKMPRTDSMCGTVYGSMVLFSFPYYLVIYSLYRILGILVINEPGLQLIIFGFVSLFFWIAYPVFIIVIISPLVQYFLTTAEPSEDKLEQSLKLAKEIEEIVSQREGKNERRV